MLINGFNAACKNIAAMFLRVVDESMSEIRFRTTANGKLSHLYYIFRKPETMGTDFKKVSCSVTGALIFIEVYIGKKVMKQRQSPHRIGVRAACTKKIMDSTKGIGKKSIKGGTKDCFLFESWFSSKKASESVMAVVAELIGMVKTNTKGFCKETIDKITED